MPSQTLLELDQVSVVRDGRPILSRLSLRVEEGQHTAILGPNGSGKTTLLRLLRREIYPFAGHGRMLFQGREDWHQAELRKRIGIVSPDPASDLLADFTVLDMAVSGRLGTHGVTWGHVVSPEDWEQARQALAAVGLEGFEDRTFSTLSTGEQRRTLIARALAHRPQLLVLDEPTAGLDLKARHELLATLSALAASGTTLLLVTHHLEELGPEFVRVIGLQEGSVAFDLPRSDLKARHLADLFGVEEVQIPATRE